MATSYETVMELKNSLEGEYRSRHEAFAKLRDFWHGRYWQRADSEVSGIESVFRDLTARQSDVGPDIKLVHNILQEVCVKYQTFLSPLPMIRCYVDPPGSQQRRDQANLKERFLYGTWSEGKMAKVLADVGWYLPLFGHAYLGAFPDLDANLTRPVLRSPEHAFPIPSYDLRGTDGVIFCWKVSESAIARQFQKYTRRSDRKKGAYRLIPNKMRPGSSDPQVEFVEFSDSNEWQRWADGVKLNGVEHKLGFNLFEEMKFISVPDEVWGHGAVEQAVNLVEMGNALYSLMFQAVLENVFPRLVLEDPSKAPEEIETGPGAVLPLNPGGKAYFLHPEAGLIQNQTGFLSENERAIKQATSMPDVNFGQFKASIVTGKAINELQGAGTGSVVEMVQGVGIGSALVAFNEKAIVQAQRMFRDEPINLHGVRPGSLAELNPRQFSLTIKGKQLVGAPRNDVVFAPHLSMHEKIVMGLQMAGAGLVSKQWQREQVGIPDSQAMDEEIYGEAITDAVLGFYIGALDPSNPEVTEQQGTQYINGGGGGGPIDPAAAAPPPLLGMSGPADVLPPGAIPAPGPAAPAGAAPAPAPAPQGVVLDQAVSVFQQAQGVVGRVFLVGEIVQTGRTEEEVEVAVTDPADKNTLTAAVPFELAFTVVTDVPGEPHIEVTPGAQPLQAGEEPTLEEIGVV